MMDHKTFILCITNVFTKYVKLVLPNKEALTVSFSIDGFAVSDCLLSSSLTRERSLWTRQQNIFSPRWTFITWPPLATTHSATVKPRSVTRTLQSTWWHLWMSPPWTGKLYILVLTFAYNTSFHYSVQAMPFFLTYSIEAWLCSFFAPDFCCLHDPAGQDGNTAARL